MRTLTASYIVLKNRLEQADPWTHLVEVTVNVNSTAFFTSHPETLTWNSQVYAPVPLVIGPEEQTSDGEMPRLSVHVANFQGMAFRFAKDNDLSLNDVVIRRINTTLTSSGDQDFQRYQILGSVFANEVAEFLLGTQMNYDSTGPRRTWNRREHPSIPVNLRKFGL